MPQSITELQQKFAILDHVSFHEDQPGMVQMRIVAEASEATVYLQGAHLTRWTPHGGSPVLYLSPKSALAPGKPIRGGVPVLFPWFGPRWNAEAFDAAHGTTSPMHGFARVTVWTLDRVHLSPEGIVHVSLSLQPDELSRSLGYDHFTATMGFSVGKELQQTLTVTNHGTAPMEFEEGLHTYYAVGDVAAARLDGLRGSTYLDKRDNMVRKVQRETEFAWTRDVDQVHVHTAEPLTLHDPAGKRSIHITKEGSQTTVIWNPWSVLTPGMPDLAEDSWHHFVCVEAVNAADDRMTLQPGATHGMAVTVRVEADHA
ncbi:MAG: D-hexose-6-phosphate mutarotase [Janthinobacterium lividum]